MPELNWRVRRFERKVVGVVGGRDVYSDLADWGLPDGRFGAADDIGSGAVDAGAEAD